MDSTVAPIDKEKMTGREPLSRPPGRVLAACLTVMVLVSCQKASDSGSLPELGKDAISEVVQLEHGAEAMELWVEKGLRNITLLHVSSHSGMDYIPSEDLNSLKTLVSEAKARDLETITDAAGRQVLGTGNYVYAAMQSGLVRQVYWIVPSDLFLTAGGGVDLRHFLKLNLPYLEDREVGAMSMQWGCLSGPIRGVPVSLCGAETMPYIRDPVVLDIGVDFFPFFAETRHLSPLRVLKVFFDEAHARAYRVALASVTTPVDEGILTPTHRYIGMEITEAMGDPKLLSQEAPPELWALRDSADVMLRDKAEPDVLLESLREPLERFPDDPGLSRFDLAARFLKGRYEETYNESRQMCEQDKRECALLVYLGGRFPAGPETGWGDRFFATAQSLRPEWKYVAQRYGDWLRKGGRLEEAIGQYRLAASLGNDIVLQFRMGDAALSLGQASEAAAFFEAGLLLFSPEKGIDMSGPDAVALLDRMKELFASQGRDELLDDVENIRRAVESSEPGRAQTAAPGEGS